MIASPQPFLTPDEYLQMEEEKMEEQSDIKHEYRDGQILRDGGRNRCSLAIAA